MILHAVDRGEARDGPPLALLHGLFGRAANFATVARHLAAERRVLALDLRNHGTSPHEPVMDYPTMAADVVETLAAMEALPSVLVGHSMGGKVAMLAALTAPAAVAALVVVDIAPVTYPTGFGVFAEALLALPLSPALTRAGASAALAERIPDGAVRAFLLQNLRLGVDAGWSVGLAEIAAALPAISAWPPVAGRYTGETLFLSGERSDYMRPDSRAAIAALFPRACFATLPTGHWVHAEDPDGFVAAVRGFVADLPRRGHSSPDNQPLNPDETPLNDAVV